MSTRTAARRPLALHLHTGRAGRATRRLAILALAVASAASAPGLASAAPPGGSAPPDFGSNVLIFDPGMPTSQIQATVDAIAAQQVPNQFGPERYALLFKSGSYGTVAEPLIVRVGYGTEVAGLGRWNRRRATPRPRRWTRSTPK